MEELQISNGLKIKNLKVNFVLDCLLTYCYNHDTRFFSIPFTNSPESNLILNIFFVRFYSSICC